MAEPTAADPTATQTSPTSPAPTSTPPPPAAVADPVEPWKAQVNGLKSTNDTLRKELEDANTRAASASTYQAEAAKHRLIVQAGDTLPYEVAKVVRSEMEGKSYATEEEAQLHFETLRGFAEKLAATAPVPGKEPAAPPVTPPTPPVPRTDDAAGAKTPPTLDRSAMSPSEKLAEGLRQQVKAKSGAPGGYQ